MQVFGAEYWFASISMKKLILRICRKLTSAIPNHRLRTHLMHLFHLRMEDSEPELRKLAMLLPSKKRCAVDIGANFGHYSIELSKYFSSVIAFEINDALTHDLSRFSKKIRVVDIGLSSSAGAATLYIPLLNGNFPLVGWASLAPGNCRDADTYLEKAVGLLPWILSRLLNSIL